MDALKRRTGQFVPFSDHLAARGSKIFTHQKIPSREEVDEPFYLEMESFRNDIPLSDYDGDHVGTNHQPDWPLRSSLTNHPPPNLDSRCRRALLKKLILPTAVVAVPMSLLAAGLLGLVFGYRVSSDATLFPAPGEVDSLKDHLNVLVDFSATRLVFVASWASTLATLLGGFIMTLWSYKIAQEIRQASVDGKRNDLPTAYQLSLLLGLELASSDRLRRLTSYSRRTSTPIPKVLKQAAFMLTLSSLLSIAVLLGDTILHYTTSTISFDQIQISGDRSSFGRGLSEACLEMNRMENGGLPCSLNNQLAAENMTAYVSAVNEISFLQSNTSSFSEIRMLPQKAPARGDVATLLPQTQRISPYLDFRASTVGVATQCRLISEHCNFTVGGPEDIYSYFNCSANFWGVLGKAPIISELNVMSLDPNVPPLAWKPAPNIQYSFFSDPDLTTVYNTPGYNLSTGAGCATCPAIPDDQLVNPVYAAIAGRFPLTSQLAGVDLLTQPGGAHGALFKGPNKYIDFVLNCAYETYTVDYVWANTSVQLFATSFTPSPNGSLAEIFHGYNIPLTVDGGDYDYQAFLEAAALQPSVAQLVRTFADKFSVKVLSVIGAFDSPRGTQLEQQRTPLLVARVPKIALAVLVASCLGYTVLGTWLFCVAFGAGGSVDIRDLVGRLSLPGMAMYAFGGDRLGGKRGVGGGGVGPDGERVFDETRIKEETVRVGVFGDPEMGGYDFVTYSV